MWLSLTEGKDLLSPPENRQFLKVKRADVAAETAVDDVNDREGSRC